MVARREGRIVGLLAWSVLVIVGVIILRTRRGTNSPALDHAPSPAKNEGWYDIRHGASGYAPIIGTFGALAVPAIIVLFTEPPLGVKNSPEIALAAGLLGVAMIASIASAIGLVSIGAEQDRTANLVPAAMFHAVAVALSLITVMAAFAIIAAIYLPGSTTLFVIITGTSGLLGAIFTAFSIGDSWHAGPSDPTKRSRWLSTQWIQSAQQAQQQTLKVTVVSIFPALVGIALWIGGVRIDPSPRTAVWLVGGALVLSLGAVVMGLLRAHHAVDGVQKGLRRSEAYGTAGAISIYAGVTMMFLP